MKILFCGLNFAPELTGIGKYSGEMVQWLASQGHEIVVVTSPPYYPDWKIGPGYDAWRYRVEHRPDWGHVKVIRCPIWVPSRVTGLTRLIHLLSFALSCLPVVVWQMLKRPSLVFMVAPTLMSSAFNVLMARLMRLKTWLHVQDFEVDAMFDMGIVQKGRLLRTSALRFERFVLRRFDMVSTISRKMLERLADKGVPPEKTTLFPNWVDISSICPLQHVSPYRKELGIAQGQHVVLYSGNMGEKQGIEVVIDAARSLKTSPDIVFVLAGAGSARERLQQMAQDLDNIRWLPLQPLERLNDLLGCADVHVLPQRHDAADLVMPSKLTGMLASGRVVVGTAERNTELGELLESVGVRVPPGDPAALAGAIRQLVDDPPMRGQRGERGRAYAETHLALDGIMKALQEKLLAFTAPATAIAYH